jgi:hypothetical protein
MHGEYNAMFLIKSRIKFENEIKTEIFEVSVAV